MTGLLLKDIRKSYGPVKVLHGIDLHIEKGEFIVFVGPSGCGKSTLLRMIAGLETITSGEVQIEGQCVNELPPSKRGIAMVFQSYALYPHMTVYDNMAFGLRMAGENKAEIDRRVRAAAETLQLAPYLTRLPKALSGGQRQRVAIGRAICRDPKVFLFDEPLSNLDAALRAATRLEIARLKASMPDATMIYVTHDQVEAMTLADRIVVLSAGRVEQAGAPLELYERPANLFVAAFIGSPAMNIVPVTLVETGRMTTIAFDEERTLVLDIETPADHQGRDAFLGVRPEDLHIVGPDQPVIVSGRAGIVEALGEVTLLHLDKRAGKAPVVVKLPGIVRDVREQALSFSAPGAKLHLFDAHGCRYSNIQS